MSSGRFQKGHISWNKGKISNRTCTINKCNNKHHARGYCDKHYLRVKKHGNPNYPDRSGINLAEKNNMWRGDDVGYGAVHAWVRKRLVKPDNCSKCNERPAIDLANISPTYNPKTYNRDLGNWVYLCRRCHMFSDGRHNNLRKGMEGKPHPMLGKHHTDGTKRKISITKRTKVIK